MSLVLRTHWTAPTTAGQGNAWPTRERLRALCLGFALAERAGHAVAYYCDDAELSELAEIPWPARWELRPLPSTRGLPLGFWSAGKLLSIRDAADRGDALHLVHADTDGLLWARHLPAAVFAEHTELVHLNAYRADLDAAVDAAPGTVLPPWWRAWKRTNRAPCTSLVGGHDLAFLSRWANLALDAGIGLGALACPWTCEQGSLQALADAERFEIVPLLRGAVSSPGAGWAHFAGAAKTHLSPVTRRLLPRFEPALAEALA